MSPVDDPTTLVAAREAAPVALLVDGDARDAIANDLDRNLFVEAGAGTGKTTALVGRIVRLVSVGRLAEPGRLAAITFTEAAAAQLRDRIRHALERHANGTDADGSTAAERARCRAAAARIDEAVITTLHGFAQRILAEHPLEAGLPPAFEVDEGIPAELELLERWSGFVDELLQDGTLGPDLEIGVTLGLHFPRLGEVARRFQDRWDRVDPAHHTDPGPAGMPDIEPVLAPLREAVALAEARGATTLGAADRLVRRLLDEVAPALARLEAAAATGDPRESLRALAAEALPRVGRSGTKDVWGADKARAAGAVDEARERTAELLDGLRAHVLARILPRLATFTRALADERRRTGRLRYHDLLVLARDLLWSPDGAARRTLAERFAVLLVDEFQDTDPLQVELVFALAAADPSLLPGHWTDIDLRAGKVLVVGDPKQSIYGFRGADISLWNRTRARFGTDVVTLSQNFRSVPSILEWVNAVFEELIGEGDGEVQPGYSALAAHRVDLDDEPAVAVLGGPAEPGTSAVEVRVREADDVVRAIAALRRRGRCVPDEAPGAEPGARRSLRYDDVALLVPTRAPLGPIERALDAADIPYRVESRSLVWRTEVVRTVLNVLGAIEDPADEVAVVAALRSPAFACSDVDLVAWRRAGGRWNPLRRPPEDLPADHPVARACATLARWHDDRTWIDVHELVDRVVRELRLLELTFAQRRPRDHWRRLRFVVDQAQAFVEAGGASLARFLEWARLQTDEGAAAVETVVPEPDDDAVRILTVHGSKGLEFPIVVLAGLATGAPPDITSVVWTGDRPEVSFSAYGGGARFRSGGHEDAKLVAKRLDESEATRLLYVAATRAREQLLVSLHHPGTPLGARSHAGALFERCRALAGTWRPAALEPEPVLLDVPVPASPSRSAAEREAWAREQALLAERLRRPAVVAPTALAHLRDGTDAGYHHADDDDSDDGDDAAPAVGPDALGDDGLAPASTAGQARGGTAFGRAVHAVLERVDLAGAAPVPFDVVRGLAARAAPPEGLDDDGDAEAVARTAAAALASTAVAEARTAVRLWREVPVVAAVGERWVEGVVDLLYETASGDLVVVDWKTDRARTAAEVDAALDRYRLQGAGYALALARATGRRIASVRFVFCRPDGAVERELTDLDAAVAEAEALLAR